MFCPKCKYEYVEGVKECPDCNVALVEELAEDEEDNYIERITVFESMDVGSIALAKSILKAEEIEYLAIGDMLNVWSAGMSNIMKIQVQKKDEMAARELLEELVK